MTIVELWLSLAAVAAGLLRRGNNGYEGRIGPYDDVGALCLFKNYPGF